MIPYVAGQTVKLSIYREGRKLGVQSVAVQPVGNGAGQFHVGFTSHYSGLMQIRAAHYATPQQAAFSGSSRGLRVVNPNVGPGSSGLGAAAAVGALERCTTSCPSTAASTKRPGAR